MSSPVSSTRKSPDRARALQRYLMLHSQHDAVQKHLAQATTSTSSRRASSSTSSSSSWSSSEESLMKVSVTPPRTRSVTPVRRPMLPGRVRSSSVPTVMEELSATEIEIEQQRLRGVNLEIKTTLEELLSFESVQADKRYAVWVESRLKDAERELSDLA